MPANEAHDSATTRPQHVFATTRWSEVLAAGQDGSAHSREALAHLCETYWYPLYAFVRRRGLSPADAQDSTQEFFSRLLAGNWLRDADRGKGRFRTFLLTALTRFLANEWDRVHAQKRGGGTVPCRWTPNWLKPATGRTRNMKRHRIASMTGNGP